MPTRARTSLALLAPTWATMDPAALRSAMAGAFDEELALSESVLRNGSTEEFARAFADLTDRVAIMDRAFR